jgi:hypothetical protein
MENNININQHKFMAQIPMSAVNKDLNLELGQLVDIEIIGKGTFGGCRIVGEFAFVVSYDKSFMILINLEKGKPYIKILYRS